MAGPDDDAPVPWHSASWVRDPRAAVRRAWEVMRTALVWFGALAIAVGMSGWAVIIAPGNGEPVTPLALVFTIVTAVFGVATVGLFGPELWRGLEGLAGAVALRAARRDWAAIGWQVGHDDTHPLAYDPQTWASPARLYGRGRRRRFELHPPALSGLTLAAGPGDGLVPGFTAAGGLAAVVAALDPPMRRALAPLWARGAVVADGCLGAPDDEETRRALPPVMAASAPAGASDGWAGLIDRIASEDDPRWRCTCYAALQVQAAQTGDAALAHAATARAWATAHPELRLAVAVLGAEMARDAERAGGASTPVEVTEAVALHIARLAARSPVVDRSVLAALAARWPAARPWVDARLAGEPPPNEPCALPPRPLPLLDARARVVRRSGPWLVAVLPATVWAALYGHATVMRDASVFACLAVGALAVALGVVSVGAVKAAVRAWREAHRALSGFDDARRACAAFGVRLVLAPSGWLAVDPAAGPAVRVVGAGGGPSRFVCEPHALTWCSLELGPADGEVPGFVTDAPVQLIPGLTAPVAAPPGFATDEAVRLLAALTPPVRAAAAAILAEGAVVHRGEVTGAITPEGMRRGLFAHLRVLLEAPRSGRPSHLPFEATLFERLATEPDPRWRCALLGRLLADETARDEAIAHALASPHPDERLAVGVLVDDGRPDASAAVPTLLAAIAPADRAPTAAVLVGVARRQGRFVDASLIALAAACPPVRGATLALFEAHRPLGEALLVDWLADADPALATAIAAVLVARGTEAAIEPLARRTAASRHAGDPATAAALRRAEQALRARLFGATGGGLELTTDGELAITTDDGRLALTTDGGLALTRADEAVDDAR